MQNPYFFNICGGAARDLGLYLVLVAQRCLRGLEMVGVTNRYKVVPMNHDGDVLGFMKDQAGRCLALDKTCCLQRLAAFRGLIHGRVAVALHGDPQVATLAFITRAPISVRELHVDRARGGRLEVHAANVDVPELVLPIQGQLGDDLL